MQITFKVIEDLSSKKGALKFALIDPDKKNNSKLKKIVSYIHKLNFDIILIGGSKYHDNESKNRIKLIKKYSNLPIVLFPGSSNQVNSNFNSMLYLNLISGRNPKYLIDEQVKGALKIKKLNIHTIPTAYILLDGGNKTTVHKVTNTKGLNMENQENVLKHALAGQYLGNKILYFDCGSGSKKHIDIELLKYINNNVDTPIMIGGGIKDIEQAHIILNNGASYIVCGSLFENSF